MKSNPNKDHSLNLQEVSRQMMKKIIALTICLLMLIPVFAGCASKINEEMKIAAAYALAGLISDDELSEEYIIPAPFDPWVKDAVASAVAQAARDSGVARL